MTGCSVRLPRERGQNQVRRPFGAHRKGGFWILEEVRRGSLPVRRKVQTGSEHPEL